MTDPLTWQTNVASELGAMLYDLFGPFSRISPADKRASAIAIRIIPEARGRFTGTFRNFADRAFVLRWITSTCDPACRFSMHATHDCRRVVSGEWETPTWGALTGGTGKWLLAEPIYLGPNDAFEMSFRHPHDTLPDLVPKPPPEVILHGFMLSLDWTRTAYGSSTKEVIKHFSDKGDARTKEFLDELLEQSRKHLQQEAP